MLIRNVSVIGSGLMGHGIAQVAATAGHNVILIDTSAEVLSKAMARIRESLVRFSEKGRIHESPETILGRIKVSTSLADGVSAADYVIEAVPEDIDIKTKTLAEVDRHAPAHAILGTNTTGLSITAIAEATQRKEKVIGMHWMNPPQIMKLVEIVKSKYTDEPTLQSTLALCREYGKETVLARRDVWFFLAARSRAGLDFEACLMYLAKAADAREIDAVVKHRIGLPMGIFELFDFTGTVDTRTNGLRSTDKIMKTHPDFEPWPTFLTVFRHLVKELWGPMSEKGLSGVKTGKGFYTYPDGKYAKPDIPAELAGKIEPIQLLAPTANVAAWCVENGVGTKEEIDKSYRLAYGWPKGIFELVDEYGPGNIEWVLNDKRERAPAWLKDFYKVQPPLRTSGH